MSKADLQTDRYVCPLCFRIDYDKGQGQFKAFEDDALRAGMLTVEHVPPKSFSGGPLVLTCKECNNVAGTGLDAHARKKENPRDAFLGRAVTKVNLRVGGYSLPATFTQKDGQYLIDSSKTKRHAHRPEAPAGIQRALSGSEDSNRDIVLNFGHDRFDADRARISWLRTAYLALFAVTGYRLILGPEMEIVRRQIREPKVPHIPTFLIDSGTDDEWTDRAFIRLTTPDWARSWGIKVGHYVVFLPGSGDMQLYQRIDAKRADGLESVVGNANAWEWPRRPSFGLAEPEAFSLRNESGSGIT